ncbi:MAG: DNA polymerase domain-containing protein, partial [Nitrospinota bacterium]
RARGWIFDIYPNERGMTLWLVDEEGRLSAKSFPFAPSFYARGKERAFALLSRLLSRLHIPYSTTIVERKELYTDSLLPVLEVSVSNPILYPRAISSIQRRLRELELFTCDIPTSQLFFYRTGLFPLARVEVEVDREGTILSHELHDDPMALDYELPPLSALELWPDGLPDHPAHGGSPRLAFRFEGREEVMEEEDIVLALSRLMARFDPHLILTRWGDEYLMPTLLRLARGRPLPLNRDGNPIRREGRARSYFSYGKVVHTGPTYMLRGRWHIDLMNSFIAAEAGLEGIFELARLAKIPVQRVARMSTGSCISAMQLEVAMREGYLIPWRKATVEEPVDAAHLIAIDKGGLTYQPRPGMYENVGEIDFASMYPSLMSRYNLSPETVNCSCCPEAPTIPETGFRFCQRRRGIVPKAIDPLLLKRAQYKERMASTADAAKRERYRLGATALKWCLVTSFGYLGYKNARFGKIEAHECTTALGREVLLQAKELAEGRGFSVLHGMTDALWVHREGAGPDDYRALAGAITEATGLPAFLEGVYLWIAFVPSKTDPTQGVPNRFYGVFQDGSLKVRGLEVRRGDMPRFIKEFQGELLRLFTRARTKAEYEALIPKALERL